jgi:hypothetical protein
MSFQPHFSPQEPNPYSRQDRATTFAAQEDLEALKQFAKEQKAAAAQEVPAFNGPSMVGCLDSSYF